ncbi:hypothetical protein [uncultured Prevotella sp.]|uniref:hypothetical protein n=1 Tax=uncultured Prevotella sp. TaxID=159272 RepID=UPI0025E2B1A2|nr:hypothetical protein [uncultured Prevotella sp.]
MNSKNATSFRRWATSVLKQYPIKKYVINQQIKIDRYNEQKDIVAVDLFIKNQFIDKSWFLYQMRNK